MTIGLRERIAYPVSTAAIPRRMSLVGTHTTSLPLNKRFKKGRVLSQQNHTKSIKTVTKHEAAQTPFYVARRNAPTARIALHRCATRYCGARSVIYNETPILNQHTYLTDILAI